MSRTATTYEAALPAAVRSITQRDGYRLRAEYTRRRLSGLGVAQAAAALGVSQEVAEIALEPGHQIRCSSRSTAPPPRRERGEPWWTLSACAGTDDPDAWVVETYVGSRHPAVQKAITVCRQCPVRTECLNEALSGDIDRYTIRGGHTPRELVELAATRGASL